MAGEKKIISTYVWSRFTINILSGVTIKVSFNSIVNKIEGLICKRGIMERISGPYLEENCSADWPWVDGIMKRNEQWIGHASKDECRKDYAVVKYCINLDVKRTG